MPSPEEIIAQSAANRAAAARDEYTIQQALIDAAFIKIQPEHIMDSAYSRRLIVTLLAAIERSRCYKKALEKGREVFVLQSTDRSAPFAIRNWAEHAAAHGCPATKTEDAHRVAQRWEQQDPTLTKWPD